VISPRANQATKEPVEPKRVPILGNANAEINNRNDRIGKFLEPPGEPAKPVRSKLGKPRAN
jgi:hypothetical protein